MSKGPNYRDAQFDLGPTLIGKSKRTDLTTRGNDPVMDHFNAILARTSKPELDVGQGWDTQAPTFFEDNPAANALSASLLRVEQLERK